MSRRKDSCDDDISEVPRVISTIYGWAMSRRNKSRHVYECGMSRKNKSCQADLPDIPEVQRVISTCMIESCHTGTNHVMIHHILYKYDDDEACHTGINCQADIPLVPKVQGVISTCMTESCHIRIHHVTYIDMMMMRHVALE